MVVDVAGADEVMLWDTLRELDVLTEDLLLVPEEDTLEFSVLLTVVGCDCGMLELVVVVSPVVQTPLLIRTEEEVASRDAEL